MNKVVTFIKDWTLPISMVTGVLIYLAFHNFSFLEPTKPAVRQIEETATPLLIFMQLLLAFCKTEPKNFKFTRWHLWFIVFQVVVSSVAYIAIAQFNPILAQGALVCLICPTATAASVVTQKLGGCAETLITYTVLINLVAAIYVPTVFPIIYPHDGMVFTAAFLKMLGKVLPLLLFPFLLMVIFRYIIRPVYNWMHNHSSWAFYLWAVSLAMVTGKTAKSIVDDSGQIGIVFGLSAVSMLACALQFTVGKAIGRRNNDVISAGQSLGQKNTVLAIWMSYTYLEPISSVAAGTYVLWQNCFNSYQLWRKRKETEC
ncbi:MAG: bile acid:sodium symporter [Salinivirgaceae bacterium]|nr:bile acid:sodium symporter [Salinivirgaceae bacterium]